MATIVLQISDTSLLKKIKQACSIIKGVESVKVIHNADQTNTDITKTKGYAEAMDDVEQGRIKCATSVDDMFEQILK